MPARSFSQASGKLAFKIMYYLQTKDIFRLLMALLSSDRMSWVVDIKQVSAHPFPQLHHVSFVRFNKTLYVSSKPSKNSVRRTPLATVLDNSKR